MLDLVKILILFIFCLSVSAENKHYDLDANIDSIISFGNWAQDTQEGNYRFILYQRGFEHVRGELRLQWLKWKQDKNGVYTEKVVTSEVPIEEINKLGFSITTPECKETWKCEFFEVMAYSTFEGIPNKKFIITPLEPGKYKCEEIAL